MRKLASIVAGALALAACEMEPESEPEASQRHEIERVSESN